MNDKLLRLAKRRELLVADAESQRLALAQNIDVWRKPLAMADNAVMALRYIKNHPVLIAGGGLALLSILRPSSFGKWFRRGWLMWQISRKLSNKSRT